MIKFGLVFAACVVAAYCAVSIEVTTCTDQQRAKGCSCCSSNPDIGCMIGGEVRINYKTGFCGKVSCHCNGTVTIETCGLIAVPVGCRVIRDLCQPYPGCCPRVVCPLEVGKK